MWILGALSAILCFFGMVFLIISLIVLFVALVKSIKEDNVDPYTLSIIKDILIVSLLFSLVCFIGAFTLTDLITGG